MAILSTLHQWDARLLKQLSQQGQRRCSLIQFSRIVSRSGDGYWQVVFTLVFLSAPDDLEGAKARQAPLVEITYNWDPETYDGGRNFGHLAYQVDDIYASCQQLLDKGVTLNRPPRDGRMAFIRSPDGISIELLQSGDALPLQEPWQSMENIGEW